MNDYFPLIIIDFVKCARFSFWALYLRSMTSHSLWIEFGFY